MNHQVSTHQKNFILLRRNGIKAIKDSTYNRRWLQVVLQSSKLLWVQKSSSIFSIDHQPSEICYSIQEIGIFVNTLSPTTVMIDRQDQRVQRSVNGFPKVQLSKLWNSTDGRVSRMGQRATTLLGQSVSLYLSCSEYQSAEGGCQHENSDNLTQKRR